MGYLKIFITSAFLLLFGTRSAFSENPEVRLRAVFGRDTSLRMTLTPSANGESCVFHVYGAYQRSKLANNPSLRGTRLVTIDQEAQSLRLTARGIGNVRSLKERNKKLFLRVVIECSGSTTLSSIVSLEISTNTGPEALQELAWLRAARGKFLRSGIRLQQIAENISFDAPVDLQNAGDGSQRIFIVEQGGKIYALSLTGNSASKTLYLDISGKISTGGERGLLGVSFHPLFVENGFFFVNYTRSADGATVISRFKVNEGDATAADSDSELIILTIGQPFSNHNGGALAFGPEGYLYIPLGDGGSGGDPLAHAQDRSTLLGDILRVDVDRTAGSLNYAIPEDNPFVGNGSGFREEIFAFGFRNPWRISFDSETGELYTGDVGQSEVEEIDIVESGKNYGWNITEGSNCYDNSTCNKEGLTFPVSEYDHSFGEAIIGGYVYRGQQIKNLVGYYIYGDFSSGRVFYYSKDQLRSELGLLLNTGLNISSFGLDEAGELYLLSYGDGRVFKFTKKD